MKDIVLADGVKFEIGMKIWTMSYVYPNIGYGNFLRDYDISEPIEKETAHCQLFLQEEYKCSDGSKIPEQWTISASNGDFKTTLGCFFSTKESSILDAILSYWTPKELLEMYREEYLTQEFQNVIPKYNIENLK